RLDSKFKSVTAAGNSSPTTANSAAALKSTSAGSIENGARHQNNSVEIGMLTAAPSRGGIQRNANWVSTKATPKPKLEHSAKATASGLFTNAPSVRFVVLRPADREINDLASRERRFAGSEKRNQRTDFIGTAETAEWHGARNHVATDRIVDEA